MHFGSIEVRPAERAVFVAGEPVSVGARAFDLLMALVERQDRVVGKGELLDLVWPSLVVEENNLQVQVSTLRKLLGPNAIATVPGRGYRFTLRGEAEIPTNVTVASTAQSGELPKLAGAVHGRDSDLRSLSADLQRYRLVTIVGVGGVGKTTLAVVAATDWHAAHHRDVAWVDLARLNDGAGVPNAIANSLHMSIAGSDSPLQSLVKSLVGREVLIVIDNAEHVANAVAMLTAAIIRGTEQPRILVTSQAALGVDGERVFRLAGLSVPDETESVAAAEKHGAVALFVDQARLLSRGLSLNDGDIGRIISICRRLDGVPLAIKLAARRLPLFGLQGLEERLIERFRLLSTTSTTEPERQRSLLATLDWSHSVLQQREQIVFRRLGVFVGGFSLELAQAVASDDELEPWDVIEALGTLVDRAFVEVDGAEKPRYFLLETARDYARLRLEAADEGADVGGRHARALLATFEEFNKRYWKGAKESWRSVYGPDLDNLRKALDWSSENAPALGAALIGASADLACAVSLRQEWRRRFGLLEASLPRAMDARILARYWLQRSMLELDHRNASACAFAEQALELFVSLRDSVGRYVALCYAAISRATSPEKALDLTARAKTLENKSWPPRVLHLLPVADLGSLMRLGRYGEARRLAEDSLKQAQVLGEKAWIDIYKVRLSEVALLEGELEEAARLARDALRGDRARRGLHLLHALAAQSGALVLQSRVAEARTSVAEFIDVSRVREWDLFPQFSDLCALLALREGREGAAARIAGFADKVNLEIGTRWASQSYVRSLVSNELREQIAGPALATLLQEGDGLGEEEVVALTLAESK